MSKTQNTTIAGSFEHLIYSPPGNIEGFLMKVDGRPVQVVFEAFQPEVYECLLPLKAGEAVEVTATPQGPSKKGEPQHPVYDLIEIVMVAGHPASEPGESDAQGYSGKVVRINYAKHGEPNGVVLDSGDFIHTRPGGFAKLGLKVGSKVEAHGDAHMLVTGGGWAVEAATVNGVDVG